MYSDLEKIKDRIPEKIIIQLTDDDRSGALDQTKVDAAVERASKEIDAWCGQRYAVPFAIVPDVVSELAADMAVYYLYSRVSESIPDTRIDGYKNAIKLLKEISIGNVSLGVDPAPTESSNEPVPASSNPGRTFNSDTLKNF